MKLAFRAALILAAISITGCDSTDSKSDETTSQAKQEESTQTWTPLPFNQTINAKFTSSDYTRKYHFFMDSSGLFEFNYSTTIPTSGTLKDSNGVSILTFSSSFKCPLRPGEYFIDWKIPYGDVPNGAATIPFDLAIDGVDTTEYNDKSPFASSIAIGSTVATKIIPKSDVDFFKFELKKSTITKIQISNIPSNLSIVVTLYDEEFVEIINTAYSINQDSIVIGRSLQSGTYYIRLRSQYSEYSSDKPFMLNVSQYAVDTTEYNNGISSASSISLDAPVKANIWPVGDNDYYGVSLNDTSTVKVSIDSASSKIELNCQIYDAEGTALSSAQNANGCRFKPGSAGTYYFRFWDNYNDASSDKLHIITLKK